MKIDILICTFRRPFIKRTLESIAAQSPKKPLTIRVIVVDNDTEPSAKLMVEEIARNFPFNITYLHAPGRNIAIARNASLEAANADYVAFLDDDETASPNWINDLWKAIQETGADAVFGPSRAVYPTDTPVWISALNYHSNIPERRAGTVRTGHTCNAILRWAATPWIHCRFDLARGRSGGEDTAFFFAVQALGAKFDTTDSAEVFEPVARARLTFGWLAKRKYRMGQSYASSEIGLLGKSWLALVALSKAGFCSAMAAISIGTSIRRNFWALRFCLHIGVVAGCLALPEPQTYGR